MKRILFIDDDPIVSKIYQNKFQTDGFLVETAKDGQEALDKIAQNPPALVIVDLMLPKVSGVDVIKSVRANEKTHNIPIIVFSNSFLTHVVQAAWQAGATKCVMKSACTPRQLLEIVSKALEDVDKHVETQLRSKPQSAMERELKAQADVRDELQRSASATMTNLRQDLLGVLRATEENDKVVKLKALSIGLDSLISSTGLAGFTLVAHLSSVLNAFAEDLAEKPRNLNASSLRTLTHAIDFLARMFANHADARLEQLGNPLVLVVDDDMISRRTVATSLDKAHLRAVTSSSPDAAIQLAEENRFELFCLDVNMPEMSGFDLAAAIRAKSLNKQTPIVFITGLSDFETRAKSTLSGATDLIAKPFLALELGLKALMLIMDRALQKPKPPAAA